jgi:CBS domain-containing protein
LEKLEKGKEIDNYISLTSLGKLERDTLKEALKTVEKFKKVVSYHFHLSMVS